MYAKGDVRYDPLPLLDRVQMDDLGALASVTSFRNYMMKRHSVRHFDTRAVLETTIATRITVAGTAPSGANHQPWHFVAVSDRALKSAIRAGAEDEERAFYAGGAGDE